MCKQNNADIRALFKAKGLRYIDVSNHLEISEATLYKWLRAKELKPKQRRWIIQAVEELTRESEV